MIPKRGDPSRPSPHPLGLLSGSAWPGLILACLALALLAGCPPNVEKPDAQSSPPADGGRPALAGYNFTAQQTSSIIDNLMHDAHVDGAGIGCVECHQQPDEFLSHQAALDLCHDCHEGQIVALSVWDNHCLSCHQFVKYKEHYADSTHILRDLCQDCHGEGAVFYRAFDPESPHDVTCDNCHHPHKSALVVAGGLCDPCHEDIVEVVSAENKVHGSCIVCHTPHSEMPDSEELCAECHVATANILVHNVPEHPKDCLACHSAHFTAAEITSDSCLVCHDDTYYGGRSNLPRAHRDCQSCHYAGNFHYMGDDQCAKCHEEEGNVVDREILPEEHRACASCHEPHSWYTAFEHNCDRCHDVDAVIEHRLTFHQATCHDCHDPHHTELMAKSGHCEGCHGDGTFPNFRADLPDMHLQCVNCHSQVSIDSRDFSFAGSQDTCLVCHPLAGAAETETWDAAPSGHQVCQACHAAHTFDTDTATMRCDLCHRDIFTQFPSEAHGDCYNCHELGHFAAYTGLGTSCHICHGDVLESAASETKRDCTLCHAPHEFTGQPDSCIVCHGDIAEQSAVEQHVSCDLCHAGHTWRPDAATCSVCHAEPPALHASHTDAGCLDCHGVHSMGSDLTVCLICHAELSDHCEEAGCTNCHSFRGDQP